MNTTTHGAGTVLPFESASSATARAGTEHAELVEALLAIEAHPGAAVLEAGTWRGVTLARWETARAARARAWSDLDAHRVTVEEAERRMHERGRAGRDARRRSVLALLTGPDGTRTADGDPIGRPELAARTRAAVDRLQALFTLVQAVPAALGPRLAETDTALRAAERHDAAGGGTLVIGPCTPLRMRLDALRQRLTADPLSLASAEQPDHAACDALHADVVALTGRLTELREVRAHADERLAQVEEIADAVGVLRRRDALVVAEVALKVVGGAPSCVAPMTTEATVRDVLARARRLAHGCAWEELAVDLPALEATARRAHREAETRLAAHAAPLRERATLRGQLELYRTRADSAGLADDPELHELHEQAHRMLWRRPVDLTEARRATTTYTGRVGARVHGGDRP